MKRILSLLVCAALAAVLLVSPAWASETAPWVEANGAGTSSLTISIRGLSGSYDSAQITLTLDKAPTGFTFDEALNDGAASTAYRVDGNRLTLYVTSKNQINQGESILLGTLAGPAGIQVTSASNLILLDLDGNPAKRVVYPRVGVGGPDNALGEIPFTDVKETDWFRDAVAYVYHAGLMNGTSATTFKPQGNTTRGMIVTILYRYEGSPAVGSPSFQDVPAGQYYTSAVAWAAEHGIVNGYNAAQFGPNNPITREQMAAIFYRYAQYKGLDVSGRADLSGYVDAGQISSYARDPMAWASHTGLIGGINAYTLQPGGTATRAQVATILMRFCENIAK